MKTKLLGVLVLTLAAQTVMADPGRATVSDVRVAPMVTTHWNQKSNTGYANTGVPCYNYYTPNGYNVGCSAVSLAQLMAYWQAPKSVPVSAFACQVDYVTTSRKTLAGAYDWANMVDDPAAGVTETQCQAIGRLTYDCAVSLRSMFTSTYTTAYVAFAFDPLTTYFGYANAIGYMGEIKGGEVSEIDAETIAPTILASLDGGMPVLMSILTAEDLVHTVVVDGYGFEGGTLYVHLNFGLSNLFGDDAWYPFLDATRDNPLNGTSWRFTIIDGVVYNAHPTVTGDVLSGRILKEDGTPAVGVPVLAKGPSAVVTNLTSATGVYAFRLPGDQNYTVSVGKTKKSVHLPKSVSADASFMETVPTYTKAGVLGNSWGNDLMVTADDLADPLPESDPLGAFNPTKAVSGAYPFSGVVRDELGQVTGTITLKIGKASKKGGAKVSGTIAMLDGKKTSIKSTTFATSETDSSSATVVIKKFGSVSLTVGANGFEATIAREDGSVLTAEPADLKAGLAEGAYQFSTNLAALTEEFLGFPVMAECLPTGPGAAVTVDKRGKWVLGKAATPKYKKIAKKDEAGKRYYVYELQGLDDPKKPNLSGLKLTYTKTTGTFKGSFYLYCPSGTEKSPKIKKYTFTVTGLVADGQGVGQATCKALKHTMDVTIQ